jgi:hypothetical protein
MPFSSTFSTAARATELLRGWKVANNIALIAFSHTAERGMAAEDMRWLWGPRTVIIGSNSQGNCDYVLQFIKGTGSRIQTTCDILCASVALP